MSGLFSPGWIASSGEEESGLHVNTMDSDSYGDVGPVRVCACPCMLTNPPEGWAAAQGGRGTGGPHAGSGSCALVLTRGGPLSPALLLRVFGSPV